MGLIFPISSLMIDFDINQPTKIAMNIPPTGRSIWFVINSMESRKFLSEINVRSDQILKLRADPIPNTHATEDIKAADFFLHKISSSDR